MNMKRVPQGARFYFRYPDQGNIQLFRSFAIFRVACPV